MIYILLAILTSASIIITFKILDKYKMDNLQSISVNYISAALIGYLLSKESISYDSITNADWFPYSIGLGFTLIIAFNLFAISTQKAGVAITAIASRMSVIIPVLLGIIIYSEETNVLKVIGILIALLAFYLTIKKDKQKTVNKSGYILPLLLLIAAGSNDSLMKIAEHEAIKGQADIFLATAFVISFILGIIVMIIQHKGFKRIPWITILGGIILGAFNWFSTYFFLKSLEIMDVSIAIPLINVGVVGLSSVVGYIFFKEKLSKTNWIGIGVAVLAIVFISIS